MKKLFALLLSFAFVLTLAPVSFAEGVDAISSATQTDELAIEEVVYKGDGAVEVDFLGHVQYKNCKVSVEDEKGLAYRVRLTKRDNDELRFRVANYVTGMTYNFTISGVRARGEKAYTSIEDTFEIPEAGQVEIASVEGDAQDSEVSVNFTGRVKWNKPKAQLLDGESGEVTDGRIVDRDKDSCEIRFPRGTMVEGGEYTLRISSLKAWDGTDYTTAEAVFTARYDD